MVLSTAVALLFGVVSADAIEPHMSRRDAA